jgi:hypothetical protein
MSDSLIYEKIAMYFIDLKLDDVIKMYQLDKDKEKGDIFLNYFVDEKIKQYNIKDFIYGSILVAKNIKLCFMNDNFLENLFNNINVTTYTVSKVIMIDKTIGLRFADYYITNLKSKYGGETDFHKIIAKIVKKWSIKHYPFIKNFTNKKDTFTISNTKPKTRHILYLLAIYYGYIWFNHNSEYVIHCYRGQGRKARALLEDFLFVRKESYNYFELKTKKFYTPNIFTIPDKDDICYIKENPESTWKADCVRRFDDVKLIKL